MPRLSLLPLRGSPRKGGSSPCWPFLSGFLSTNMAQSWKIFWLTVFMKENRLEWAQRGSPCSEWFIVRTHTYTHTVRAWVWGRNGPWAAYNCATSLQKKAVSIWMMRTWPDKSTKCKVAKVRWDCPWKKPFHHSIVHWKFTLNWTVDYIQTEGGINWELVILITTTTQRSVFWESYRNTQKCIRKST